MKAEVNRFVRRLISGAAALIFSVGADICSAGAAAEADRVSVRAALAEDYYAITAPDSEIMSFGEYYDLYSAENRPDTEIVIAGADNTSAEGGDFGKGSFTDESGESRDNALLWNSADGQVTYRFEVPETGNYCLAVDYCPMISTSTSRQASSTSLSAT